MDFETLSRTRRSVRGYKPDLVPRALIEQIIEVAKRAPSSMNTQPWHVHVLAGAPLERVRQRNMETMAGGAKANRDIISHGEYEGVHRARQLAIAVKLFGAMGIARDDKPMRQDWVMRGLRAIPRAGLAAPPCISTRARSATTSASPHGIGAWQGAEWPGHHALGDRARGGRDSQGPGDHDRYRAGPPG